VGGGGWGDTFTYSLRKGVVRGGGGRKKGAGGACWNVSEGKTERSFASTKKKGERGLRRGGGGSKKIFSRSCYKRGVITGLEEKKKGEIRLSRWEEGKKTAFLVENSSVLGGKKEKIHCLLRGKGRGRTRGRKRFCQHLGGKEREGAKVEAGLPEETGGSPILQ